MILFEMYLTINPNTFVSITTRLIMYVVSKHHS